MIPVLLERHDGLMLSVLMLTSVILVLMTVIVMQFVQILMAHIHVSVSEGSVVMAGYHAQKRKHSFENFWHSSTLKQLL